MLRPRILTFTGADDRTDLKRMDAIARAFPEVEWGILFSPANRDARYPCKQAVSEMLDIAGRKAAHLCGGFARSAVSLLIDDLVPLERFQRCQLNGGGLPRDTAGELSRRYGVEIIFQTQLPYFPVEEHCSFLYDGSGGTGKFPEKVPPRSPARMSGYAGGMGPETVLDYLKLIEQAGGEGEFWLDMENRVRTNGWFDLDKVERVCELVFR